MATIKGTSLGDVISSGLAIRFTDAVITSRNRTTDAPVYPNCLTVSVSWHGPNLLFALPHVKSYVSFYFPLHQRPHLFSVRYRKPHSHRLRTLALEVMEFIRRFLQHVLPTGFMKVRYYGFMNPNCGVSLDHISTLTEMAYGFNVVLPKADLEPWQPITCPSCGGTLRLRSLLLPSKVLVWPG